MRLPINIEELLGGRAVEGDRIEYKTGWNPDAIYRSVCASRRSTRRRFWSSRCRLASVALTRYLTKLPPSRRRTTTTSDITVAALYPRGEYERELINLANRTPFDDRGNDQITLKDISPLLLYDYLVKVKSSLASESLTDNMESVLEQMELLEPTPEGYSIKNVAAMMFAERPDCFFKQSQVEIVLFPEGREKNPNNLIEVEPIRGSVPTMIEKTLSYLETNVIKKQILKPKDREESDKFYNYPYQALEETVVNSLYHRDWTIREPVEITIEPDRISILNFSGPNHTIPMEAVREGKSLRSRRYRNRRLGEFLKELDLTEGRATGIPTVQEELEANGSPRATIETDEERTYFLIDIPCHPGFMKETLSVEQIGVKGGVKEPNVTKDVTKELTERQSVILEMITEDSFVTIPEMSLKTGVATRTIKRDIENLQSSDILTRKGGRKDGEWIVTELGMAMLEALKK